MTAARNHVANALARLPHQYRGNGTVETNTQKLVRVLLSPAPVLEQAMQDVLLRRSVDTAVGVQLDVLGKLVGRQRGGIADDEVYRRFVRAQIAANRSNGLIDDILAIARLVVNDDSAGFAFKNQGVAAYALEVSGVALPHAIAAVLISLLLRATEVGTRPILEYSTAPPASVGRWTTQGTWGSAVWGRAVDKEM